MRLPSRRLAPQVQNHQAAPPRPSGGGVRGPGDPPLSPPPSRWGDGGRPEKQRPCSPRGGRCTRGGGHRSRWTARTLPHYPLLTGNGTAALWRAQTKRPTLRPAWGRRRSGPGRGDLPPPPPATLTHWRPTGPRLAPKAARQPRLHLYTPGGRAGDKG